MAFTKQETDLLMVAIEESLNPNELKRFEMIKGLMSGKGF